MVRPLLLAAALLLPGPLAAEEPPPPTPEVLAQASDWLLGRWTYEERVDLPGVGRGLARAVMEFRADGTMAMTGTFTPEGAHEPDPRLGGRMTATWWIEQADPLGLRVRLEEVTVTEGEAPPRPGGLAIEVMNLQIRPDGTLYDFDDGIGWRRQGS